jgi:hypothetical protein
MNSYLIWIPSLQEFKRFKEFKTKHQRELSKLADENVEFIYALNTILKKLCVDPINFNKLTIIDKYIICLYLRIRCIGEILPLTLSCPKCGVEFTENININNLIQNNISTLDQNYTKTISIDKYTVTCDVPLLSHEYDLLKFLETKQIDKSSVDHLHLFYTFSYIKNLTIKNTTIDFASIPLDDVTHILTEVPSKVIKAVQTEFMTPLSELFNPGILNTPCPTKSCPPFIIDLNLNYINDIIKLLFQESPLELLREIYYLSKQCHINPKYIDNLTPKERDVLMTFLIEENKAEREAATASNKPKFDFGELTNEGFDLPVTGKNDEFGF